MRIGIFTGLQSPHELPVMRALAAAVGPERFRYVVNAGLPAERRDMGWVEEKPCWLIQRDLDEGRRGEADAWEGEADLALFGDRTNPALSGRVRRGKLTIYASERWYKPPLGVLRLLHPGHLLQARRFGRLLRAPCFRYLPIGVHAARDMRRLYDCFGRQAGLRSHDISMLLWGYFVSPSCPQSAPRGRSGQLRILWVGRMLRWKRVDTLVHAASSLLRRGVAVHLDLFGLGPEEVHLRHLAGAWTQREYSCAGNAGPAIVFHRPISMDDVRRRMRESDVYVLPSSGYEGWGTVLNEAMLEGCAVIATHDGGAAKTLIRDGVNGLLFRAGDTAGLVAALARLEVDEALRLRLATAGQQTLLAEWTPDVAADRLLVMAEALTAGRAFAGFPHGPLMAVRAADDEAGGGEP